MKYAALFYFDYKQVQMVETAFNDRTIYSTLILCITKNVPHKLLHKHIQLIIFSLDPVDALEH